VDRDYASECLYTHLHTFESEEEVAVDLHLWAWHSEREGMRVHGSGEQRSRLIRVYRRMSGNK
jgi:hypothetical protein